MERVRFWVGRTVSRDGDVSGRERFGARFDRTFVERPRRVFAGGSQNRRGDRIGPERLRYPSSLWDRYRRYPLTAAHPDARGCSEFRFFEFVEKRRSVRVVGLQAFDELLEPRFGDRARSERPSPRGRPPYRRCVRLFRSQSRSRIDQLSHSLYRSSRSSRARQNTSSLIRGSVVARVSSTPAYVSNSSGVGSAPRTQSAYPSSAVWMVLA